MVDDVELAASADGDHRADFEAGGEKAELNIHRFRCQLSAQFLHLKLRLREELALYAGSIKVGFARMEQ